VQVEDTNLPREEHRSRFYKGERPISRNRPRNCEEEMPSSAGAKYLGMLLEESFKNSTTEANYF
jgi:hypothetical protein